MPNLILEGILKAREETIAKLLGLWQDTIESLVKRTYCNYGPNYAGQYGGFVGYGSNNVFGYGSNNAVAYAINNAFGQGSNNAGGYGSSFADVSWHTSSNGCVNSTACNLANLGLLISALHPLGLGSQKVPATEVKICISKLVHELNEFPATVPDGSYPKSCSVADKLRPKVKEILDDIPSVVKEHHKRHMEEQAKKSGVEDLTLPEAKGGCIIM
jgi:hypothetical protein